MLLRGPSEKLFDQSICRKKEQKARLQCSASAMPKSVMRSGAKNGKVSKEKCARIWQGQLKRRDGNVCFSAKPLSSNLETVALTRAPENVGENHDINFEARLTLKTGLPY